MPVRSTELYLIEVEDSYGYKDRRQSTIQHLMMNKKLEERLAGGRIVIIKIMAKQTQIFYKRLYRCVYTAVNRALYMDLTIESC